jgi:SAM-dependent methyltransferase
MCPICMSIERHRLACLFFEKKTNLFEQGSKKLLHIAPEEALRTRFKAIRDLDYLSADLEATDAMVKMDITNIQFPDNSFNVIFCSHVLEHVLEDRKAMREFYRVLTEGGWLVVIVPDFSDKTFEDSNVTSPEEREKVFGQRDHVRIYGQDFRERLCEAGFEVEVITVKDLDLGIDPDILGIPLRERLYYCKKNSVNPRTDLNYDLE